jgi:hypothetical protein
MTFFFENYVNEASKSSKEKNISLKNEILVAVLKVTNENSRSGSGRVSQRHGSADPDRHQNVTDPQHC